MVPPLSLQFTDSQKLIKEDVFNPNSCHFWFLKTRSYKEQSSLALTPQCTQQYLSCWYKLPVAPGKRSEVDTQNQQQKSESF